MPEQHQVLVLKKELSGESFLKLHLLGPELGTQLCLKRLATKRASPNAAPDLFDTAQVQLEISKQGTIQFIREYRVEERRSEIGLTYRSLRYASDFSNLVLHNGSHMADLPALYQLVERSLNTFAKRMEPSVVFLKSLYLLLQDEGYPVREAWWPSLPRPLRQPIRDLLAQPSPVSLSLESEQSCQNAIHHLLQWLEQETDLRLPTLK